MATSGRTRLARSIATMSAELLASPRTLTRDVVKAHLARSMLRGRSKDELTAIGIEFGRNVITESLRTSMLRRLHWHRRQGHCVVIVSASLRFYLEPVAEVLGVDVVLCTELEFNQHGIATGELFGANCRGQEKVNRLIASGLGRSGRLWPTATRQATPSCWRSPTKQPGSRAPFSDGPAERSERVRDGVGDVQSVVVFGGTSEIALAVVHRLMRRRCRRVVLAVRNCDAGEVARQELATSPTEVAVTSFEAAQFDSHEDAVARAFAAAGGDVDVVIVAFGQLGDQADFDIDPDAAIRCPG